MKAPAIFTIILASVAYAVANYPNVEGLTSHVFTDAVIIWQAPTNELPQNFWIYQRKLPRIFSEEIISNAIVLGALQRKGFPKPSTNDFSIGEDEPPNWPTLIPIIFGIRPDDAMLFYQMPGNGKKSDEPATKIPADKAIEARARKYARELGINADKLILKNFYTHFCVNENQDADTNAICGRGIFLSRQLDGIAFFSGDEEGDGAEGLSVEFGSYGKIRYFSLGWSDVQRIKNVPAATPQEIVENIQRHKILVLPHPNEEDYFTRLEKLAAVKRLVITKITPYYFKGVFGEVPTNDVPSKLLTPVAELDAVADFGSTRTTIRMLSPITSFETSQ